VADRRLVELVTEMQRMKTDVIPNCS